jgi:cell division protein FtsQ
MILTEFRINGRGAWQIKLASGLAIQLGRTEQLKKLQRFLKTLSVLDPAQIAAMAVVDLRYPNGYAVAWKPEPPELDWKLNTTLDGLATPQNN